MRALITGITGQDGSYMADLLLEKGYEVHGFIRRSSTDHFERLRGVHSRICYHVGDMTDALSLRSALSCQPDEIYNFAALSDVRLSYDTPASTIDINAAGVGRLLEAVRQTCPSAKIYQASSSEMFGRVLETPQTERTPFNPRSPYGCSKVAAFHLCRSYREAYGMQIYNGILFNHESPRRGENFLSRKVCKAVAEIAAGKRDKLTLGNLEAKRDWGYAKEYVYWIWFMLRQTPDDYLLATGETHSVQEFVDVAFNVAGFAGWQEFVETDPSLKRPAEVDLLLGNSTKATRTFGFVPRTKFKELVHIMVDAELQRIQGSYNEQT